MGVKEAIHMSEESLVSPLLDGFVLGTAMSTRPGVSCYPAMKENSSQKYIVKILSVPASQVQLDALLVTGAYSDPAAALDYFRQQADDTAAEAEFLQGLAKLEGFISYEGWQVTAMKKDRLGYQVYLVSKYGRTLEKAIRRNSITQQQAVSMALDMCAALSLCRRAGYLYIDLKPSNIMVDGEHFKIADLGFVSTRYLNYASMPERYISEYTAPEVKDPMACLNTTLDTYALGMILYRLFNNGKLPLLPEDPTKPLDKPVAADEAMTQIILKACAPKPEERWQDPTEMGQALVQYMQTGTIADTLLVTNQPEETPVSAPEEAPQAEIQEKTQEEPVLPESTEAPVPEEAPQPAPHEETPSAGQMDSSTIRVVLPETVAPAAATAQTLSQSTQRFDPGAVAVAAPPVPDAAEAGADVIFPVVDTKQESVFDLDSELDAVKDMLKPQAKYPTSTPRPVRKPVMENVTPVIVDDRPHGKGLLVTLILLMVVGIVGFFSYWFYNNFYLQTIDGISVTGTHDQMTVTVSSQLSDSLLTVYCTDVYGNSQSAPLSNGQATFTGLVPNSLYNVMVGVEGLHKLTGQISDVFTTEGQTEIVEFSAISGQDEGYVLLNLTVNGHEPEEWVVSATCEGEDNVIQSFTGHSVTVKGLTVGKEYNFRLSASDGSNLGGQTSVKFQVVSLITASNLEVISRLGGELTVGWSGPENISVGSWSVRCYSDDYDETQTVTGTIATFSGTLATKAYTVEVTPAGMTEPTRLTISANPITIGSIKVSESSGALDVSWTFDGKAPEDGWLLMYTMNDSESSSVIKCTDTKCTIEPMLPDTVYHLTLQVSDDTSIFNNTQSYTTSPAATFSTQGLSADKIKTRLLKTPSASGWLVDDLTEEDYTSVFQSGDKLSMALEATVKFYVDHEDIQVMFVFFDSQGNPIPTLVSQETIDWYDLFYDGKYQLGELDLPKAPTESGDYSVTVYFNGSPIGTNSFVIS